jgi:hypothetical protein
MTPAKKPLMWLVIILASIGFFADLAFAALPSPDGAVWAVTSRTCAQASQAPTLNERVEFQKGLVTHTQIKTATAQDYCEEGRTYARQVKTKQDFGGVYVETAMLVGQNRRVTCFSKATGAVTSDTNYPLPQGRQTMTVQVMDNLAYIDIGYSAECPKGLLHMGLKK